MVWANWFVVSPNSLWRAKISFREWGAVGVKIEEMGVLDFRVEGGKLRCRISCGGRKWCWRIFFLQGVFERVFFILKQGAIVVGMADEGGYEEEEIITVTKLKLKSGEHIYVKIRWLQDESLHITALNGLLAWSYHSNNTLSILSLSASFPLCCCCWGGYNQS
jgi:hypothetical protein